MLTTILATVVVLGVLIFVHELGHFFTAKLVDIEVPRFSIGLGPKLVGFRRGETEYVISWLPLGGYVKMAGMEEMEKLEGGPAEPRVSGTLTVEDTGIEAQPMRQARPRDFESKSLAARTLVISAGVIMNLLFAVLVFAFSALVWGVSVIPEARVGNITEERLPAGTEALSRIPAGMRIVSVGGEPVNDFRELRIAIQKGGSGPLEFRFEGFSPITVNVPEGDGALDSLVYAFEAAIPLRPVIGTVGANTAAARASLKAGDRIVTANGKPMESWHEFVAEVEASPNRLMRLQIERDGQTINTTVTPDARDLRGGLTFGRVGVTPKDTQLSVMPRRKPGPAGAIAHGFSETWNVIALTVDFLGDLFTGQTSARNLGGPIQIGQISGQVARLGLEAFLSFMALLSVNLAVLNLLPIPVLDGGHLMFLAVEAVRGRALSLEQRLRLSQVGFVIVLAIMVWAMANDVLKLFGL
ncbi:MAG: RIP metalloprotease RseP [Longimicrobiales bacterium]